MTMPAAAGMFLTSRPSASLLPTFSRGVTIFDVGNDTRITIDGNSAQRILLEGITNATRITIDDFLLA